MTPFHKFLAGLKAIRSDFNENIEEIIGFAEIMANKKNALELDEDGAFYVTASGPLEEIIPVLEKQLDKLRRIKKQKDGLH